MLSTVSNIVLSLGITPFIVDRVGLRAYGFWSVLGAILQYAALADGALPTVTMRRIAVALSENDSIVLREVVATTVSSLFLVAAGLMVSAGAVLLALPPNLGSGLPSTAKSVALMAAGGLSLTILSTSVAGVTRAKGRWDLDSAVQTASQLAGAGTTIWLLLNGDGLLALGYSFLVTGVVLLVGYTALAIRFGAIGSSGFRPRRAIFRDLWRQGRSLQIVALVGATNAQADRLMLLPFAPLSFIGAYALGSRVAVVVRSLPLNAFGPLMVRFATVSGVSEHEVLTDLYRRSLRLMTMYLAPLLLGGYCACFPAILAWLGPNRTISATGAVILGVGYALNITTGPGTSLAIAVGKAELDRDYNLLGLGLNLVLSFALGIAFGPWGVVVATTVGLAASSVWLINRVDREFSISAMWNTIVTRDVLVTWGGIIALGAGTIILTVSIEPMPRLANLAVACVSVGASLLWIARNLRHIRSRSDLRNALLG
jgi:O-antigen/teichoic acid export membrane protein